MTQGSIIQFKPDVFSLLQLDIICLTLPVNIGYITHYITAIETDYESFKEEFSTWVLIENPSKSKTDKICGFCPEIVPCLILRGAPLSSKTRYDGESQSSQ